MKTRERLFNVTVWNRRTTKLIQQLVGKKYSVIQAIRLGGIGFRRMSVIGCSDRLETIWHPQAEQRMCGIEIRQGGIILRFKSRNEVFAWVIPFDELDIELGSDHMQIKGADQHMRVQNLLVDDNVLKIGARILSFKEQLSKSG